MQTFSFFNSQYVYCLFASHTLIYYFCHFTILLYPCSVVPFNPFLLFFAFLRPFLDVFYNNTFPYFLFLFIWYFFIFFPFISKSLFTHIYFFSFCVLLSLSWISSIHLFRQSNFWSPETNNLLFICLFTQKSYWRQMYS